MGFSAVPLSVLPGLALEQDLVAALLFLDGLANQLSDYNSIWSFLSLATQIKEWNSYDKRERVLGLCVCVSVCLCARIFLFQVYASR